MVTKEEGSGRSPAGRLHRRPPERRVRCCRGGAAGRRVAGPRRRARGRERINHMPGAGTERADAISAGRREMLSDARRNQNSKPGRAGREAASHRRRCGLRGSPPPGRGGLLRLSRWRQSGAFTEDS